MLSIQMEKHKRIAFQYNPKIEYDLYTFVVIESMNNVYKHCKAFKHEDEPFGMCYQMVKFNCLFYMH